MPSWSKFAYWLDAMMKERRIKSYREASLGAGLDHAAISRYMSGTRPSVGACHKLAVYFGVPERLVLEMAEYFPPEEYDEYVKMVAHLASQLPQRLRPMLLGLLRQAIAAEKEIHVEFRDKPGA